MTRLALLCLALRVASAVRVAVEEEGRVAVEEEGTGLRHEDLRRLGRRGGHAVKPTRHLEGGIASLAEIREAHDLAAAKPVGPIAKKMMRTMPPRLRQRMQKIWTPKKTLHVIESQLANVRGDMIVSGYTTAYEAFLAHARVSLEIILHYGVRRFRQPCSQLPEGMLGHVWRYRHEDLRKCLRGPGLETHQSCAVRCALFPKNSVTLTCGAGAELEGAAHEAQCRNVKDPEVVQTEGGAVQGVLRPIIWSKSLTRKPKKYHPLGFKKDRTHEDPTELGFYDDEEKVNSHGIVERDGFTLGYVRTFWQIPFGRPPVRFKRPVKASPWMPKTLQLPDYWENPLEKPPRCEDGVEVRQDGTVIGTPDSDCLTLHVYAPTTNDNKKRPVLYWIPGTGFTNSDVWSGGVWDMGRLAFWNDMVVVVSNWRSGLVGHWATRATKGEDRDGGTGNWGLMDQRLALEWVKNNIAKFGGDPKQVTVGGVSSGGFSAIFHLYSPASRGLFRGVAPEGASFDTPAIYQDLKEATQFYDFIGSQMGCPAAPDARAQLLCLRNLPHANFSDWILDRRLTLQEDLLDTLSAGTVIGKVAGFVHSSNGGYGRFKAKALDEESLRMRAAPLWPNIAVGPVVDGSSAGLPKKPWELMAERGGAAPVAVYSNMAKEDGTAFAGLLLASYPWYKFPTFTHAAVDQVFRWVVDNNTKLLGNMVKRYPVRRVNALFRFGDVVTDLMFRCPARRLARRGGGKKAMRNMEDAAGGWPTVYLAEMYYAMKLPFIGSWLGASHLQSGHLFNNPLLRNATDFNSWDPAKERMRLKYNCHFAAFVHCNSPGVDPVTRGCAAPGGPKTPLRQCSDPALTAEDFPEFKPFDHRHPTLYAYDLETTVVDYPTENVEKCDFWDTVPPEKFPYPEQKCFGCNRTAEAQSERDEQRRKKAEKKKAKKAKTLKKQGY